MIPTLNKLQNISNESFQGGAILPLQENFGLDSTLISRLNTLPTKDHG